MKSEEPLAECISSYLNNPQRMLGISIHVQAHKDAAKLFEKFTSHLADEGVEDVIRGYLLNALFNSAREVCSGYPEFAIAIGEAMIIQAEQKLKERG
jgi:hypothetical protein